MVIIDCILGVFELLLFGIPAGPEAGTNSEQAHYSDKPPLPRHPLLKYWNSDARISENISFQS